MKTKKSPLANIHPVDKSLLLFMVILMLQSAYTIFFPQTANALSGDIDVIVRTSAAAIFGYFLSANFVGRPSAQTKASLGEGPRIIEPAADKVADTGPKNQIGFTVEPSSMETGGAQLNESEAPSQPPTSGYRLQVMAATGIGLFCLLTLIVMRHWPFGDYNIAQSDSVNATVVQFRDFVSGCVGFLIGCPTDQNG